MASQNPNRTPLYPTIPQSNPDTLSLSSSSPSLYPKIDPSDLAPSNLFPQNDNVAPSAPPESVEEVILTVPGSILHLIDKHYSVQLACGDLSVILLRQGQNVVAVLARVDDEIQWPLAKDLAAVKLDECHYFFSLRPPKDTGSDSDSSSDSDDDDDRDSKLLNYGLTIASKGQESLIRELDNVLEQFSSFSVQRVQEKGEKGEVLDGRVAKEVSPGELMEDERKKEMMEGRCAAYWTTLAPNVEDYGGMAAKMVAAGSGQLIKGILWCGDVTVDRLRWGNEVMKKRMKPGSASEISPETLKRIKRVKKVSKLTEKVAIGVLSGVVKVSGFFTSSVANSKVGKKFFGLLPGEVVLASLDGFSKICDAVEVAGKSVMSTSSTVTTGLVSHRYGEEAAKATSEGLDAAGHAVGTAWAVFKIRKALNPKSVLKPTTLTKSAAKTLAAEKKKKSKSSK
ncbi:protein EARLY-RESPONSIVE TO DEHYDRATION 7, chloroplastic [Rhododendron vialii]|uniref:protein EARLY-RESPONSIVE TO DEHYDRATION 7, chloroplastic n=1 Tax=Rhododendron vialii TaxID=182163 RepID=UPI00266043E4|nr:protein EARLY-RESPONSIVE TO DEHYDRATION 7, chloroplastic [Rhododendron vialii]